MVNKFSFSSTHVVNILCSLGNLVPPYDYFEKNNIVGGECAALELACSRNNVPVITVFGHSDCKAMNLLYRIRNEISIPSKNPLDQWLKVHAKGTVEQFQKLESSGDFKRKLVFASAQHHEDDFEAYIDPNNEYKPSDKLSQVKIPFVIIKSDVCYLGEYIGTNATLFIVSFSQRTTESKRAASTRSMD